MSSCECTTRIPMDTNCDLPADIGVIYEEFADVLYNYSTMSFGFDSVLCTCVMYLLWVLHDDCAVNQI